MKVSVTVPVYNTGKYLRRCIDSICRQSHSDLQIIMIDDGSQPVTAGICDDIARSDRRIELVHKQNEGVSVARNNGLDMAVGDIVCFVDSDDTIEPQMIEKMVAAMERDDADIAICDAVTITPGKPDEPDTIADFDSSCVIATDGVSPVVLSHIAGGVCRCAYRRTLLLATQARFPEGIKFSEDRIFNLRAMSGARRIAYLKEPLYDRLIREGSACFRYYPDMTEQIVAMRALLMSTVRACWGPEYVGVYEQQIAGQIRSAVTNFTARNSGLTVRGALAKLKELCRNRAISDCLTAAGADDMRGRLILKGDYRMLYLVGVLTNMYHRIWRRGQYRA